MLMLHCAAELWFQGHKQLKTRVAQSYGGFFLAHPAGSVLQLNLPLALVGHIYLAMFFIAIIAADGAPEFLPARTGST